MSLSVRQHDMLFLGSDGRPLIPALSWQCNAATVEVEGLCRMAADMIVGRLYPRLGLPKISWAVGQISRATVKKISAVLTTGDYIAYMLTGAMRMSRSDALSNGFLRQSDRLLATCVLESAGLKPAWFPKIIKSDEVVGIIHANGCVDTDWQPVAEILPGWRFVSPLGDNHAGAVGCGLCDLRTIIVSAGTSGTAVRVCKTNTAIEGKVAQFEFYDDVLLLNIVNNCGARWDKFKESFGEGLSNDTLDKFALEQATVPQDMKDLSFEGPSEYPSGFREKYTLAEKAAWVRSVISWQLYQRLREMNSEVIDGEKVNRIVLTGGMSQSPYFRKVFVNLVKSDITLPKEILVSARTGPAANKSAAVGAMINAMVGAKMFSDRETAMRELCPLAPLSD